MFPRYLVHGVIAIGLLAVSAAASAADYVSAVEVCGQESFIIELQSGKDLYVALPNNDTNLADITWFNSLYALAVELLASQKQISWYNNVGTVNACGLTAVQQIDALQGTNRP